MASAGKRRRDGRDHAAIDTDIDDTKLTALQDAGVSE